MSSVDTVTWHLNGEVYTTPIESGACPFCLVPAVTKLPKPLLEIQPDGTTHVCHPSLGGCNHGFADERGKAR
jgi:hypothetical protein